MLVSVVGMPLASKLDGRGVPPKLMGAIGFTHFFFSLLMMSGATVECGPSFFFWPMIVKGLARGFLFVPFTKLAMQELSGKKIGQGTGMNNLMRPLGGSFGIAILTTVLQTQVGVFRSSLISPACPSNQAFQMRFDAMTDGFMAKGFATTQARSMLLKAIEVAFMNQAQARVLFLYRNFRPIFFWSTRLASHRPTIYASFIGVEGFLVPYSTCRA